MVFDHSSTPGQGVFAYALSVRGGNAMHPPSRWMQFVPCCARPALPDKTGGLLATGGSVGHRPLRALPLPSCASLRSTRGVLGPRHARALASLYGRCLACSPLCPGRRSLLPPDACPPPVFSTRSPSVLIGYRPPLSSHSPPVTHSVPVSVFFQHVVPPAVRRQHPCAAEWLPLSVPSIGPTVLLTLTVVVAVVVCPWSIPVSTPPYPPHGASRPRARCGLLTLTLGAPPVAVVPFCPHRVPSGARGGRCGRAGSLRPLCPCPMPPFGGPASASGPLCCCV